MSWISCSLALELKEEILNLRQLLMDAKEKIGELEDRITALTSGESCAICSEGRLKVASSKEHPQFGFAGVLERTLKCDQCGHIEKRMHDPNKIITGKQ